MHQQRALKVELPGSRLMNLFAEERNLLAAFEHYHRSNVDRFRSQPNEYLLRQPPLVPQQFLARVSTRRGRNLCCHIDILV